MNIKAQIPNAITLLNLFCGCIALVFASEMDFKMAFFFVALGIFFDFFDGFFARKFNVSGPLGVQLDSLADMVTSGFVPGFVMFKLMSNDTCFGAESYFSYLGFIITLGSCYRLAKFNIDERQSDSFIGLPTPANALFILSLPLVLLSTEVVFIHNILGNPLALLTITVLSTYIMNAEIPLFSLKIKNFSFQKYKLQVFFLLVSISMLVVLHYLAIPLVILTYVILSVITNAVKNK
jgi:CDP-diacylglycerol--serine O-phosphatidyltransferase